MLFSCEFCEISKNTSFTENLSTTAPVFFLKLLTASFIIDARLRYKYASEKTEAFRMKLRLTILP